MKDFYFDYEYTFGYYTLAVDNYKHKDFKREDVNILIGKAFNTNQLDDLVWAIKKYFFDELYKVYKCDKDIKEYKITMKDKTFHFTLINNL